MEFLRALKSFADPRRNLVIPDIKCHSPRDGDLLRGRDPVAIARELERAGAPALSVVTEETQFHGSLELLKRIAAAVDIPVLRKDFIRSRDDLAATAAAGAAAVLLMCSCLRGEDLVRLYGDAPAFGLDVLLETHDSGELAVARRLNAALVGVNNRDILKLERDGGDVARTEQMARLAPEGAFLISESALSCPEDVRRAVRSGADAALVGTAILSDDDPAGRFLSMSRRVNVKICGLTDREGIDLCAGCGVDTVGFVTEYPEPVPWNLSAQRAQALIRAVPSGVRTAVVTGGSPEKIVALGRRLKPDYVQLHHRETLEETERIADELKKARIEVIKAIPVDPGERLAQFGTARLEEISARLGEAGVSALLVDPRGPANAADARETPPLEVYRRLAACAPVPVVLAGGITPENAAAVLEESGARWIDVMTGCEDAPGRKSEQKIRGILRAAVGEGIGSKKERRI